MIKDTQGKIPNYVIIGDRLMHQPSQLIVDILPSRSRVAALREADRRLKALVKAWKP